MSVIEQIKANLTDSPITAYVGLGILMAGILCESGVFALYLSPAAEHAWCSAAAKIAFYVGGAGLTVSRSPTSPPR